MQSSGFMGWFIVNYLIFRMIVLRNTVRVNHFPVPAMTTSCPAVSLPVTPPALGDAHRWKVLAVGVAANASFSAAANGMPTTAIWLRSGYHLSNTATGRGAGRHGPGRGPDRIAMGHGHRPLGRPPRAADGLAGHHAGLAGPAAVDYARWGHGAAVMGTGGGAGIGRRAGRQRERRQRPRRDALVRHGRTGFRHEHPPDGRAAGRRPRRPHPAQPGIALRLHARVWRPGPRMRPVGVFYVAMDA